MNGISFLHKQLASCIMYGCPVLNTIYSILKLYVCHCCRHGDQDAIFNTPQEHRLLQDTRYTCQWTLYVINQLTTLLVLRNVILYVRASKHFANVSYVHGRILPCQF